MDQISPLPVLTQDEVRVAAWAEVREPLERQLAPLGWRALAALAPRPGEYILAAGASIDDRARCIHDLAKGLAAGQAEAGYPVGRVSKIKPA
jgi:hypothetical protein